MTSEDHTASTGTYFTRYALDYATINTTFEQVLPLSVVPNGHTAAGKRTMLTHPVLPPVKPRADDEVTARPASGASSASLPLPPLPLPTTSQLTVDCVLHRKDRLVAFEQIMATSEAEGKV